MRIGVFTALLSKLPLVQVLEKLQSLDIHTVELGTGNYPGDPHCPLSLLTDRNALREFKLQARRSRIFHQRAELSRKSAASEPGSRESLSGDQPEDRAPGREARRARGD